MSKDEAIEVLSDIRAENNLFGDETEATRYHALSWAIEVMTGKKGKWIAHGVEEGMAFPVYTCSVCGGFVGLDTSRFCPECGAEMERDQ